MDSPDLPHVDSLETERLHLRRWKDEDLEPLAQVHTDPAVAEALRRPAGSVEQVRKTFDYILGHWDRFGFGPWATFEKASDRFIGNIGLEYMADWPFEDKVRSATSSARSSGDAATLRRRPGPACGTAST